MGFSSSPWLPRDVLSGIKVVPVRKRSLEIATKQMVTRETGYAIVSAEGFETVDKVVFAEPGDMALLGVRTIEGFGGMVDDVAHRFVATTTIVATAGPYASTSSSSCQLRITFTCCLLWPSGNDLTKTSGAPASFDT